MSTVNHRCVFLGLVLLFLPIAAFADDVQDIRPVAKLSFEPSESAESDAARNEIAPKTPFQTESGNMYGLDMSGACVGQQCTFVAPRFSLRHDVGDGVGYNRGFTYFQGFVPLRQSSPSSLFFGDFRVVNFDDDQQWEFNGGGGWRYYDCVTNRIWGANVYYDGRNTDTRFYHQIGVGFESLGRWVDFRVNGYIPLGTDTTLLGFSNPRFRGFNLLLDRNLEGAMRGFEVEAGVPIPGLERFDARAFLGYYHYRNDDLPKAANGVSGRLEAQINEAVSAHFSIQHDDVFDTTVTGGLAVHFGHGRLRNALGFGRCCRTPNCIQHRLGDRVVRDPNIVISRQARAEPALDPHTKKPYDFLHVAPGGNSNGSFEDPYGTLAKAFADPRFANGNVVVYDRTSGAFTGNVNFAPNTYLLSNSPQQILNTVQLGNIVVPLSGAGGPLPTINGHIIMAPLGTLSGFNVNGRGQSAAVRIAGSGRFHILNNVITNLDKGNTNGVTLPDGVTVVDIAETGIFGSGFGGNVLVVNNAVTTPGTALFLAPTGTDIDVTASTFTATGTDGSGLDLQTFGSAQVTANFSNSTFIGSDGVGAGIRNLKSFDNSALTANFTNCLITGGKDDSEGINDIESRGSSSLAVNFTNCTITGLGDEAIEDLESFDKSTLVATFTGCKLLSGVGGSADGIDDLISHDDSKLTVTFLNSSITGTDNDAIEDLVSLDNSTLIAQFTGTTLIGGQGGTDEGIDNIVSSGTSRLTVSFLNSSITGVDDDAIENIRSFGSSTLIANFTGTTLIGGQGGTDEGIDDIVSSDKSNLTVRFINSRVTGTGEQAIENLDSTGSSLLRAIFTGSTFTAGKDAIVAETFGTSTLCLDAMNNTLTPGAGFFGFDLTHNAGSTFNVVDFLNLSANNNGATVTTTGTITDVPICP